MNKKSSVSKETNPFRIVNEERVAQKPDLTDSKAGVGVLGGEMLPGSQASPAKQTLFHRITPKMIFGIFIGSLFLGMILYSLTGFGRMKLEKELIGLVSRDATVTSHISPTIVPVIDSSTGSSSTPRSSPTIRPTWTKVVILATTKTYLPTLSPTLSPTNKSTNTPIASITPTPSCRNVDSITLSDVGKILCVQGVVIETREKLANFLVIFSNQKGALYWVSYDMVWSAGEVGTCYQITGKIDQIGNNPIMIFDYGNKPTECP